MNDEDRIRFLRAALSDIANGNLHPCDLSYRSVVDRALAALRRDDVIRQAQTGDEPR